ncbi:DUF3310 domain-containing protein [Corynebacterium propinquum]
MNKTRYIAAIVTEEDGTFYPKGGAGLTHRKKDTVRFDTTDDAKIGLQISKLNAEDQGLTVVSTAVLEDYEHFSIDEWSKAKPQKVEPSGDFYVTPSRNKKPGPEDKITPEPTECNLRVEDNSVDSPAHYQLAEGMEAIDVIDQAIGDPASFYRGNALKYLLRAGRKGDAKQDLEKARWYIDRELNNE